MTIDLSLVTFDNDLFQTDLPDGSILSLYALNEAIESEGRDVIIDDILLQVTDIDGRTHGISSIIGMSTGSITIASKYSEVLGDSLTRGNMAKCTIEVAEDE